MSNVSEKCIFIYIFALISFKIHNFILNVRVCKKLPPQDIIKIIAEFLNVVTFAGMSLIYNNLIIDLDNKFLVFT